MSGEPQLFRVDPKDKVSERIEEVEFTQLGFQERRDIQEWVAANPSILGDDLLIIGKEFQGFDRTNERLDLLAVDSDGKLVIIELKRDDTGADAHWQAIKYASYFRGAGAEKLVGLLAKYADISQDEAQAQLAQHLGPAVDSLNGGQRIILASHRFAPEVTSAALWLNEKVSDKDLITCVTLVPYRDSKTDSLYVQATTIIPVPGEEGLVIELSEDRQKDQKRKRSTFAEKLAHSFSQHQNDEVTAFLRKVEQLTVQGLTDTMRPSQRSRWAGLNGDQRYYHLWYSSRPWSNWGMSYRINMWRQQEPDSWWANVEFIHYDDQLGQELIGVKLHNNQKTKSDGTNGIAVDIGAGTLSEDFAHRIADMMRMFIENITPLVNPSRPQSTEPTLSAIGGIEGDGVTHAPA